MFVSSKKLSSQGDVFVVFKEIVSPFGFSRALMSRLKGFNLIVLSLRVFVAYERARKRSSVILVPIMHLFLNYVIYDEYGMKISQRAF